MDEIFNSQIDSLKINDFLNSAKQFTKENFPDLNISEIFNNSITGTLGEELLETDFLEKIFSVQTLHLNLASSMVLVHLCAAKKPLL